MAAEARRAASEINDIYFEREDHSPMAKPARGAAGAGSATPSSWYGFSGPAATTTSGGGGGDLDGGGGGGAPAATAHAAAVAPSPELASRLRALEDATRSSHGALEARLGALESGMRETHTLLRELAAASRRPPPAPPPPSSGGGYFD